MRPFLLSRFRFCVSSMTPPGSETDEQSQSLSSSPPTSIGSMMSAVTRAPRLSSSSLPLELASFSCSFVWIRFRRCFSLRHQIFRRLSGTLTRSWRTGVLFSSSKKRLRSSLAGFGHDLYHSLIIGSS